MRNLQTRFPHDADQNIFVFDPDESCHFKLNPLFLNVVVQQQHAYFLHHLEIIIRYKTQTRYFDSRDTGL